MLPGEVAREQAVVRVVTKARVEAAVEEVGLVRRYVDPARALAERFEAGARVPRAQERRERLLLDAVLHREVLERFRKVPSVVGLARVTHPRVGFAGVGVAEQVREELAEVAEDERAPENVPVVLDAEALHAVRVGDATFREPPERLAPRAQVLDACAPDTDRESIAREVSDSDLRGVAVHRQDADLRVLHRDEATGRHAVDRHPLGRDGTGVLQARVTDRVLGDLRRLAHVEERLEGREPALLHLEEEVVALLGRPVEREFLDAEILGCLADAATESRDVGGQPPDAGRFVPLVHFGGSSSANDARISAIESLNAAMPSRRHTKRRT